MHRSLTTTVLLASLASGPALAAERTLYTFGNGNDGGEPLAGLIADAAGNLYGTTSSDGANSNGLVFELIKPTHGGKWTETVLYSFAGGSDGGMPQSRLLMDQAGNLYGTTYEGGIRDSGTVFKLTPPAGGQGAWTETVLYSFTDGSDGGAPWSTLIADSAGVLYGTASDGGTGGSGVVFALAPPKGTGTKWTETVLYAFAGGTDGAVPFGNLVLTPDGDLYGTAASGGANRFGTVWRLVPRGGAFTFDLLHAFTGGTDGAAPRDGLLLDASGNFYGTTAGFDEQPGSVFQLAPQGSGFTETALYTFHNPNFSGNGPWSTVSENANGVLYGTSLGGGTKGYGMVFSLTPPNGGGAWTETTLYSFLGGKKGGLPYSTALIGPGGVLYGTAAGTIAGSSPVSSIVWSITP